MAYPSWQPGMRITAARLAAAQPLIARKTADTARPSTTTATADPELQFEVEASAVYLVDGWIKYDADSAADLFLDWTVPTGALGEWTGWGIGLGSAASTTNGYPIRVETNDVDQSRTFAGIGAGNIVTVRINATWRVGGTGGTISLDWSQVVSNATATTLYTDSWLRAQRIQ